MVNCGNNPCSGANIAALASQASLSKKAKIQPAKTGEPTVPQILQQSSVMKALHWPIKCVYANIPG